MNRRSFLRTSALAVAATGAAGAAGATPGSAQSVDFGGWFDGVSNFDGVVDRTGESEVRVSVGGDGNGGAFAFSPPAVRVDPGTTVVWEWTGKGGSHNVVADDGAFESDLVGESGYTFEQTFDEAGVTKYYCMPHEAMGMKGAVVVGDAGGSGAGSESTAPASASGNVEYLVTGVLAGAILTVLALLPISDARSRRQRTR